MNLRILLTVALAAGTFACNQATNERAEIVAAEQQAVTLSNTSSGKPDAIEDNAVLAAEPQARIQKQKAGEQVSTRLTVRLHKDGQLEIIDAVELPGYLRLERHLARSHVYEASLNGEVLAVQGIDVSFEQRALSPERDITLTTDNVELFVDIPGLSVDEAENVEIAIHELDASHGEKLASIASVDRIRKARKAKRVALASGQRVRQFIRGHARRARRL